MPPPKKPSPKQITLVLTLLAIFITLAVLSFTLASSTAREYLTLATVLWGTWIGGPCSRIFAMEGGSQNLPAPRTERAAAFLATISLSTLFALSRAFHWALFNHEIFILALPLYWALVIALTPKRSTPPATPEITQPPQPAHRDSL